MCAAIGGKRSPSHPQGCDKHTGVTERCDSRKPVSIYIYIYCLTRHTLLYIYERFRETLSGVVQKRV